jgi:hypothetical protein
VTVAVAVVEGVGVVAVVAVVISVRARVIESSKHGQFWRYFQSSQYYANSGARRLQQQLKFGQIDPELK